MKFISRSDIEARTANPSPEALKGYSIDAQLRTAAKAAVKPLAKKLAHYRSERARLEANCARWNPEAYAAKLDAIASRAHGGDEEAAHAIESGAVPSRQSFVEMHARTYLELENFDRDSRALFAEVMPLISEPMTKVVDRGQEILDHVLEGLGIPRFELTGWRNHISYVLLQVGAASRNETADLAWFWSAVE
jgi:hypothetical protein